MLSLYFHNVCLLEFGFLSFFFFLFIILFVIRQMEGLENLFWFVIFRSNSLYFSLLSCHIKLLAACTLYFCSEQHGMRYNFIHTDSRSLSNSHRIDFDRLSSHSEYFTIIRWSLNNYILEQLHIISFEQSENLKRKKNTI